MRIHCLFITIAKITVIFVTNVKKKIKIVHSWSKLKPINSLKTMLLFLPDKLNRLKLIPIKINSLTNTLKTLKQQL